ncbi:MAG: cytochrome b/b6 domain-containing protein [Arcobacteraceae bacterium]|jgi:cytochrome b561|nr:cytochrome b/b6 domain-containing protein [Arcobacteraceae bacterium]
MNTKYQTSAVLLHWIIGAILSVMLVTGTFILSNMPNTIDKIDNFTMHMILGIVVTILSIIRVINIYKSKQPLELPMSKTRAKMMKLNHIAIYAVVILVGISGIIFSQSVSLGDIVFFGKEIELYQSFKDYTFGVIHGFLTKVLIFLIVTHVIGVLSYSIKNKVNIVKRMWF